MPSLWTDGGAPCPGLGQGIFPTLDDADAGLQAGDTWRGLGLAVDHTCVTPMVDGRVFYEGYQSGHAHLDGCGSGYMEFRYRGTLSPSKTPGALFDDEAEWELIPAKGTGAFAGATGGGNTVGAVQADFSSVGVKTGNVSCPNGSE